MVWSNERDNFVFWFKTALFIIEKIKPTPPPLPQNKKSGVKYCYLPHSYLRF